MILVKIKEGEVDKDPYTLDDLRADNPSVSFPEAPSNELLIHYSAAQVFYYPYPIFDKRTQYVNMSQTPVLIDGIWSMKHIVVDKTTEEITAYDDDELKVFKTKLFDKIDAKTSNLIAYGCVYLGKKVRLNTDDQTNFEGAYNMIKDYLSDGVPAQYIFPTVYKVWTNEVDGTPEFMSFANIGQLKSFIYSGKIYIQACLSKGWEIKNTLNAMTLDQLKAWVDPR